MKYRSFVGIHPVPVVYGMTIGEYARMINGEGWLKDKKKCDLTVIPCQGWKRSMTVDLPRKPSPNLPDKVSVMLYTSVCFFEGTVVKMCIRERSQLVGFIAFFQMFVFLME